MYSNSHNLAHIAKNYANEPNLKALFEEAKREGWRRCYRCGEMVQLFGACNLVTCNCAAKFWYVSGFSYFVSGVSGPFESG